MSKKSQTSSPHKSPKSGPKASPPAKKRAKGAAEAPEVDAVVETPTEVAPTPPTPAPDANIANVAVPEVAAEDMAEATPSTPQAATAEPEANLVATDATSGGETPVAPAPATKSKKTPKPPKEHKPSGLDAAAQVLAEKGEPMTCQDIVATMLAKGLWQTGGKTPAATIYSAMLREIDGKPGESRFVKTGRGLFGLTSMTPATTDAAADSTTTTQA